MIRAGASDEEILQAHPKWPVDVLSVCHKIVDGTLCDLSAEVDVTKRFYSRRRVGPLPMTALAKEAQRLKAEGFTWRQIAGRLRVSASTLRFLLKPEIE